MSAAAALACIWLLRRPVVGVLLAVGICIIVAFYQPDFSLRLAPVLLLLAARDAALRIGKDKKAAGQKRDGLYTLELFSVLACIGVLTKDISFAVRNPVRYTVQRFDWILFGAVVCTALLTAYALTHKTVVGKMLPSVYVIALIAVGAAAVGYVLNAFLYDVFVCVFPWLICLASGGGAEPVTKGASEYLIRQLRGHTAAEE